ncbi:hypothetical protein DPMN_115033 [Dreissena polymorpha]|uniref:Uncharacterized protein n=1 Tax=Dreissena polymorpha TaxID=45954 RepID=A0A9D4KKZ7_DREPO|nr:hypothetical protein DPMN_115033 [Dreissena polymorpha]
MKGITFAVLNQYQYPWHSCDHPLYNVLQALSALNVDMTWAENYNGRGMVRGVGLGLGLVTKIVFTQRLPLQRTAHCGVVFHEDRKINVASRVLTRKNAPLPGSHTNLLTKFHEDWAINVASRGKCPDPGGHVFKATKTIFKLIQYIIGTNLLTMFHDDRKINVTSRPRPCGGHVFQPTGIIFELVQDIIGMNLLIKFHEDRTINVASREKGPAPRRPCYSSKNKFHQDWTINVASRVLTSKNAPPPGGHVFQPTGIIFELFQDIIGMNFLTKFH